MEFLGVPNPYKARGHANTCISAYLNEGIAKQGTGFFSVFSNKSMASGYGHIWCNVGDGAGTFYESNGAKPLIVTKGKTYAYDMVCNFDKYINLTESNDTQKTYTQEEWDKLRAENQDNWDKWQAELKVSSNLRIEIEGKKEEVKSALEKHKKLVEYIINKIAPLRAFIDQSEESAKGAIVELVSLVDSLNETIRLNQKEAEKKEQELVKKNEDLQSKLDTLQAQFDKLKEDHARELKTMQNRIDKVQEQVEANTKEVTENNKFKQFLKDFITKLLKG